MPKVCEVHNFRGPRPDWLDSVINAVEAVPDELFFDRRGLPILEAPESFVERLFNELELRFDLELKELVSYYLPSGKFSKTPFVAALFNMPDESQYACMIVPVNHAEFKLKEEQTPFTYMVRDLMPLLMPVLELADFIDCCVIGYTDPRGDPGGTRGMLSSS